MESDMEAMLAQTQGGRGGGETTVPDKYVFRFRYSTGIDRAVVARSFTYPLSPF